MNPAELEYQLSKKFKVLKFIDLSLVVAQPTVGFTVFKEQYKEVFEPNERIVFYTGQSVGAKTLAYMQYAADLFDISRCFILVCCLENNNNTINKNDIEFLTVDVEAGEFNDNNMISLNSICSLPWFHSEYMNTGEPKICCFNSDTTLNETVKEYFHSEKIVNLRKQLLAGQYPESCNVCWKIESNGSESLRQWRNKTHKEEFFTNYLDHPTLKSLAIRPSTVCNFKCRSCSPAASSLWAQEKLKYETDPSKKQTLLKIITDGQWFDTPKYKEIIDIWPDLEFVDIYGGEPLMIKQFKQLLEVSIKSGASKKQRLHFNTNGSLFPVDLIELMHQFQEVTISLSIDDIEKRFEIIRGGIWKEIDHNVDQFLSCDHNIFKVSALVTVSNLNILYLDELISWAEHKNLLLTFNILNTPGYLAYNHVTQTVKELIIKKYQNHPDSRLKSIVDNVAKTQPIDGTEWVAQMVQLDLRRGQNMLISHYDLASGMGYTNSTK